MRILHYFLGFPPYRSGGLTKYAFDLMQAQVERKDQVIAFWPGEISLFSGKIAMKKRKSISGIENYELINPLPVPLDEGIQNISAYTKGCDGSIYEVFLKKVKPDAIHIHTLMGLHKEFVEAAEKLKIFTVFTTHDYFGICPKVTMYRNGRACEGDSDCRDCVMCNTKALSMKKIFLMQHPFYRMIKDSVFVKKMRQRHRGKFFYEEVPQENFFTEKEQAIFTQSYQELRKYYREILERIDRIHFNSTITQSIYKKYMNPRTETVLSITHKDIQDRRREFVWSPGKIFQITMLAAAKPYKGFDVLCEALDQLWGEGKRNFHLMVFGAVPFKRPYMTVQEDGYSQEELKEIFRETDFLAAPSTWYETFGFTVLEAISYGIPVLVSDRVGAKDIIGEGGMVISAGNVASWKLAIQSLTADHLKLMRKNIREKVSVKLWKEFVEENDCLYKR